MNNIYRILNDTYSLSKNEDGTYNFSLSKVQKFNTKGKYGTWEITEKTLNDIVKNFKSNVTGYDIEGFVTDDSTHTGKKKPLVFLKDLYIKGKELIAKVLPINTEAENKLQSGEYQRTSPEFMENYQDKRTGKEMGATLTAFLFTNQPYQPDLTPAYMLEEDRKNSNIIYLSENNGGNIMADENKELSENAEEVVESDIVEETTELSETTEEVVEEITEEVVTDEEIEEKKEEEVVEEEATELSEEVVDETLKLSDEIKTLSDTIKLKDDEIKTLSDENKKLSDELKALNDAKHLSDVESFVTFLKSEGKLSPVMEDSFKALCNDTEGFEKMKKLAEVMPIVVKLSDTTDSSKDKTGSYKLGDYDDPAIKKLMADGKSYREAVRIEYPRGVEVE